MERQLSERLNNLTVFCFHTLFFVQVMLNAAPSFLNVFHRLVASIMQEGRQRGDGDTGKLTSTCYDGVTHYREIHTFWRRLFEFDQ